MMLQPSLPPTPVASFESSVRVQAATAPIIFLSSAGASDVRPCGPGATSQTQFASPDGR
jgi:hypothetical protein